MAEQPLIIFPVPEILERIKKSSAPQNIHLPRFRRQIDRVNPQLLRLQQVMQARRAELVDNPYGVIPEKVLVIETIGSLEDFIGAVKKAGMEWLIGFTQDAIGPDDDFYDVDNPEKLLSGKFFLVMTDQAALNQLLSLWNRWRRNRRVKFEHGFNAWKNIFIHIKEIRFWNVNDRLQTTGVIQYWQRKIEERDSDVVRFETELWYRKNSERRIISQTYVSSLIETLEGRIVNRCIIDEIAYHSLLAELPLEQIPNLINFGNENIRLLKCDEIMYFRPVGQQISDADHIEPAEGQLAPSNLATESNQTPVVALFDGFPLEQHTWLNSRMVVDDPDGWATDCPARLRRHGTAMASLILHGDVSSLEETSHRRIYVRPILKPLPNDPRQNAPEFIPDNELPVDLIHRSVRRLFERSGGQDPVAPSVRIINLSIGIDTEVFYQQLSSLARLLDWLSWKYKILFVISAGNHKQSITLNCSNNEFDALQPQEIQEKVIEAINNNALSRKLLAPSESINSITVGALHSDGSTAGNPPNLFDPYVDSNMPSPINALGLGYRRSVKPDILASGGRVLFRKQYITAGNAPAVIEPTSYLFPPGQCVAIPSLTHGELSRYGYTAGTSNAAAITSKAAMSIFDHVIETIKAMPNVPVMEKGHEISLIKTLLVHGASWGGSHRVFENVISDSIPGSRMKEHLSRFFGYGHFDINRVLYCTDQRATILGWGNIALESAESFSLPLPPSITGQRIRKRMIVTLSWITPTKVGTQLYRGASLWLSINGLNGVNDIQSLLRVNRQESDWRAVRRGTLQHEILLGEDTCIYNDGDLGNIIVNCAKDAGDFNTPIPYAIAVTLEVEEATRLPIYDEIRTRILTAVPITA